MHKVMEQHLSLLWDICFCEAGPLVEPQHGYMLYMGTTEPIKMVDCFPSPRPMLGGDIILVEIHKTTGG